MEHLNTAFDLISKLGLFLPEPQKSYYLQEHLVQSGHTIGLHQAPPALPLSYGQSSNLVAKAVMLAER